MATYTCAMTQQVFNKVEVSLSEKPAELLWLASWS